jgi:hypothetical protein
MNKILPLFAGILSAGWMHAQCVTIGCGNSITVNTDTSVCGAAVTFSTPIANSSCTISIADTFQFTGGVQTYTVPVGVNQLDIQVWGAQGGANWVNNTNFGGYTRGTLAVTPGEVLQIYVGGQPTTTAGGYNGGGAGDGAGKGGGGATDVRRAPFTLNDRIAVAGGGGGAGFWSNLHVVGGVGGGLIGGNGYRNTPADAGGLGASQTGPGANGTCVNFNVTAMAGGFGFGGTPLSFNCGCEGYGGGGGWYGGAGSGNCRGGGGGSGYILPAATNVLQTAGVRAGNGMVVLTFNGPSTPVVTQTAGLPSGSLFPVGTTTNAFLADDGAGNTATCSFTVTVNDNEMPVITQMPGNITATTDSGMCTANIIWLSPIATDNCAVTLTSSANSGDTFPVGTTTVVFTATDASGNLTLDSIAVTVTDQEAPIVTCSSNITISADSGMCYATNVNLGSTVGIDNCNLASLTNNADDTLAVGTHLILWTATDASGNASTCQQTVTIVDTQAPSFNSCPQDITICPGIITFQNPEASDNCGSTVTQVSGPTNGSSLTAGTYQVTFAATDASGNSDTCSFTITVNPEPVVTLSITTPNVCADDAAFALIGANPAGGTFSGNGVSNGSFSPAVAGVGTHIINYAFVDTNGCSGVAADTIVVNACTGISEHGKAMFTLYPNPNNGMFTLNTGAIGTVVILDQAGRAVYQNQMTSGRNELNLQNASTGLYTIRFTDRNGNTNTQRLHIQH